MASAFSWVTTAFWETLIKSMFYGEPTQLCDAGMNKIKVLAPLILLQKFPHLFNQYFLSLI
ncbi:MAG: hypothetical protein FJY60_01435 [Betaproteobacteria bacterium]|nr:hypothetical protein [Betaproteobacteria bacterium]